MDRALMIWVQCKALLASLGAQRKGPRQQYSDSTILLLEFWAALNNQPVKWACRRANWPGKLPPGGLPSPSGFSRRVHTPRVVAFRRRLEALLRELDPLPTDRVLTLTGDGHALPVAKHSRDPHARHGRGAGGPAKGYKLHPLCDADGRVASWRLSTMNTDEGQMLRRMLDDLPREACGYLLADASYDDNWLFGTARTHRLQLVAPRKRPGTGLGRGKRRHDPARRRCVTLLEPPLEAVVAPRTPGFGASLYDHRDHIERRFGHWASTPELNPDLPAWVRRYPRVHRWVHCKIIAIMIDRLIRRNLLPSHAA